MDAIFRIGNPYALELVKQYPDLYDKFLTTKEWACYEVNKEIIGLFICTLVIADGALTYSLLKAKVNDLLELLLENVINALYIKHQRITYDLGPTKRANGQYHASICHYIENNGTKIGTEFFRRSIDNTSDMIPRMGIHFTPEDILGIALADCLHMMMQRFLRLHNWNLAKSRECLVSLNIRRSIMEI